MNKSRTQELIDSYSELGIPLPYALELLGGQIASVVTHYQILYGGIHANPNDFVTNNPGIVSVEDAALLTSPDTDPLTFQVAVAVATMSCVRLLRTDIPATPGEFA